MGDVSAGPDERGSVLALMPAAVLVVLVLSALAVDHGLVLARQRELVAVAEAVASDAANTGVPGSALYGSDPGQLDARLVASAARRSLAARGLAVDLEVTVSGDGWTVAVALSDEVRPVFGAGLPGRDAMEIEARATATARRGGPP